MAVNIKYYDLDNLLMSSGIYALRAMTFELGSFPPYNETSRAEGHLGHSLKNSCAKGPNILIHHNSAEQMTGL